MKYYIDPGRERKSVNFLDNIVYSKVHSSLKDCDMELKMSIMTQNGNSEMRAATGKDDTGKLPRKPAIVWIPGGGFRGSDKNLMTCEMEFLADAGYVVASIYYRSSFEGVFPDQIVDVKTAIRFLRANAEKYRIDPDHIGVIGRSAGGTLSSLAAMNLDGYDKGEWLEQSSRVQACVDMFGPSDFFDRFNTYREQIKTNSYRWTTLEESHEGAVIGGTDEDFPDRTREISPALMVSKDMCPICILHGDSDPLVPASQSELLYDNICKAGMEDQADLYVLKNGGHGSDEFFQPSVKEIILKFFDKYLK